jgi:hypothetical protein
MGLMSDQAPELDSSWRNSYFEALEAAQDPAQATALLARLQGPQGGGQQLNPDGTPASTSMVMPEATPYPTPEAAGSFGELLQDVPNIQRIIASGDAEAAQQAAWELAERYNATADAHAREKAPHHYPPPPATDDQGLRELIGQAQAMDADPGAVSADQVYALAERVNGTVGGIRVQRERDEDALERQRQAAEARRAAQRWREQPTIEQLKRLVAQYEAGQQPAGR